MKGQRLNPTLFDKLVSNLELSGLRDSASEPQPDQGDTSRQTMRYYALADVARYNETALRANVRRELAWLLNCANLESSVDLTPYPQIRSSVLNYGISDMSGKAQSPAVLQARAAKIKEAIAAFEPRLNPRKLTVAVRALAERENAVTFVISGDITTAVEALHAQYVTDIEIDTGATTVRE